jgi:hypothetical protein
MEGSYKHIEYAVSNSRQWVILQVQLGGWPGANTPPPTVKLKVCYETLHTALDKDGFFGTTQKTKE